jgi:hypothetical protein
MAIRAHPALHCCLDLGQETFCLDVCQLCLLGRCGGLHLGVARGPLAFLFDPRYDSVGLRKKIRPHPVEEDVTLGVGAELGWNQGQRYAWLVVVHGATASVDGHAYQAAEQDVAECHRLELGVDRPGGFQVAGSVA